MKKYDWSKIYEEMMTSWVGESAVDDHYKLNYNRNMTKKWYQSRTLWLAVAQAVAGALVAFYVENPAVAMVGWGAVVKSALDWYLRYTTK